MIAKYNVKVNGQWYKAGEEIPEAQKTEEVVEKVAEPEVPAEAAPVEEEKESPKPRTAASRRKSSK